MDGIQLVEPMSDNYETESPCDMHEQGRDASDPGDAADSSPQEDAPPGAPSTDAAAEEPAAADSPAVTPMRIVEALLFAAESALPGSKIAQTLGVGDARDVRRHVQLLNDEYEQRGSAFRIEEIAGGYQMMTLPVYHTWLTKLKKARHDSRLSTAAMETLSVVAYKQPVTRAEIESIRGVAAGEMLNRLRELDLVKIVGRAEDLGRPLLYGTTRQFLEVFGLGSLEDLPKLDEAIVRSGMKGAGLDRPAGMPDDAPPAEPAQAELPQTEGPLESGDDADA